MKIAITGATGFIGRHVVDELVHRGFLPIAVGRNKDKLNTLHELYGVPIVCTDIRSQQEDWYTYVS